MLPPRWAVISLVVLVVATTPTEALPPSAQSRNGGLTSIISINVGGALLAKVELLRAFVKEKQPDILVVCETGVTKEDTQSKKLLIQGAILGTHDVYHVAPWQARKKKGAQKGEGWEGLGISVFVHKRWGTFVRANPVKCDEKQLIAIKIVHPSQTWNIVGIYGNPGNKKGEDTQAKYWARIEAWYQEAFPLAERS